MRDTEGNFFSHRLHLCAELNGPYPRVFREVSNTPKALPIRGKIAFESLNMWASLFEVVVNLVSDLYAPECSRSYPDGSRRNCG